MTDFSFAISTETSYAGERLEIALFDTMDQCSRSRITLSEAKRLYLAFEEVERATGSLCVSPFSSIARLLSPKY